MITKRMLNFLEYAETHPEEKRKPKYAVYLNRIQKKIDRDLDSMLKLACTNPKILLDEEREVKDDTGRIQSHRRLKKLLLTVKALNPKMEVELVLKNIDFPEPIEVSTPMTS
jgi:hypothetical protein